MTRSVPPEENSREFSVNPARCYHGGVDVNPLAGNATTPPTEWRELLHRVAASPRFRKSKRLRELLLYLGERSLQDPAYVLREQEIGVEVFGRAADYDTSHDTLVRVQVSQLRKKLQEHFSEEGRDEPLIVEIPKGNYVPVFRPRAEFVEAAPAPAPYLPPPAERASRRGTFAAGVAAGILAMGLAWLIVTSVRQSGGNRSVDDLWRQLFGNGQTTYAVLADVNLMIFENLIGRTIPVSEYETHEFDRLAEQYIPDAAQRALAREVVHRVSTSVSDVLAAREFGLVAAGQHLTLNLLSARDSSSSLVSSQNTILLGSLRSNPWISLFEDQLNFRTDYREKPAAVRFVNHAPMPGEPGEYWAEWRRTGFCRVAFLPNPKHTGNVLLISGTDVISTEAGARFVTSEDSVRQLRQKLALRPGEPFPHFELLLKTQVLNDSVPRFELVAYRPHKRA
jgi:hypothetical protein